MMELIRSAKIWAVPATGVAATSPMDISEVMSRVPLSSAAMAGSGLALYVEALGRNRPDVSRTLPRIKEMLLGAGPGERCLMSHTDPEPRPRPGKKDDEYVVENPPVRDDDAGQEEDADDCDTETQSPRAGDDEPY